MDKMNFLNALTQHFQSLNDGFVKEYDNDLKTPDEESQYFRDLLERGLSLLQEASYEKALEIFIELIEISHQWQDEHEFYTIADKLYNSDVFEKDAYCADAIAPFAYEALTILNYREDVSMKACGMRGFYDDHGLARIYISRFIADLAKVEGFEVNMDYVDFTYLREEHCGVIMDQLKVPMEVLDGCSSWENDCIKRKIQEYQEQNK